LRRRGIVCAVVMISWGIAVYALPRFLVSKANAAPAKPGAAAGAPAASLPATAPLPRVIVAGVTARALSLYPAVATSDPGIENSPATVFLTAVENREQLFAFPAASNVTGSRMAAIAGTGAAGSLGDGGPALRAQFALKLDSLTERSGVAVAADQTIFVADTRNSTIRRVAGRASSESGIVRSIAGRWGPRQAVALVEPLGIALDRGGSLYVADQAANAVLVLRAAASTNPAPLEILAHVASPSSMAVYPNGSRIFVASPETGKIFSITPATHSIEEVVIRAAASSAITPAGLAVDGGGNLFVADAAGNQIIRREASSGALSVAAGNLRAPGEIAFDADGNLFVSEQGLSRVVELEHLGVPASSVTITPPAPLPPPAPPLTCPATPNSPTAYNFCTEPEDGATPSQPFILTNSTAGALFGLTIGFNPVSIPPDFQVISSSCTQTLPANSSCTINVAFTPQASGERDALLTLTYAGAANPVTSPVAGTGDDYQIVLPTSQSSTITVVNGSAAKYQMQINPDSLFGGPVAFVCPGNMPAQTTCMITPANPVPVTPGTSAMFTAVFQTTSRVPIVPPPASGSGPISFQVGARLNALTVFPALLAAAFLGLWGFQGRRGDVWLTNLQAFRLSIVLLILAGIGAIATGCGGGNGTSVTVGTPAGTTIMTLQGRAQGASRGVTVTLIVQ
jgi:DNA-binding beta-propeller fold protein YncE